MPTNVSNAVNPYGNAALQAYVPQEVKHYVAPKQAEINGGLGIGSQRASAATQTTLSLNPASQTLNTYDRMNTYNQGAEALSQADKMTAAMEGVLTRMRDLASVSNSDSADAGSRSRAQQEFNRINESMRSMTGVDFAAPNSPANGANSANPKSATPATATADVSSLKSITFGSGDSAITLNFQDTSPRGLGVDNLSNDTQGMSRIDEALQSLRDYRTSLASGIGSMQEQTLNGFQPPLNPTSQPPSANTFAASIRESTSAQNLANTLRTFLGETPGQALLGQGNTDRSNVMTLLQ